MKKLTQRQYAFIGLAVVLVGVMLARITPKVSVSESTRNVYQLIDTLPTGSTVLISFDHEASALPEIRPLAQSIVRQAFTNDIKIVGLSLLAEGTLFGYQLLRDEAKRAGKSYDQDYIYLGYKPQPIAAILSMTESMKQSFPQDYAGRSSDSLTMLTQFQKLGDFQAVISVADGNTTTHWVEYGQARSNVRVIGAVTAAMATSYDPYVQSGQLSGLLVGLRGAAEYESLLGEYGPGMRGMVAQTSAHLYIILLILVGNLIFWWQRRTISSVSAGGKS